MPVSSQFQLALLFLKKSDLIVQRIDSCGFVGEKEESVVSLYWPIGGTLTENRCNQGDKKPQITHFQSSNIWLKCFWLHIISNDFQAGRILLLMIFVWLFWMNYKWWDDAQTEGRRKDREESERQMSGKRSETSIWWYCPITEQRSECRVN